MIAFLRAFDVLKALCHTYDGSVSSEGPSARAEPFYSQCGTNQKIRMGLDHRFAPVRLRLSWFISAECISWPFLNS